MREHGNDVRATFLSALGGTLLHRNFKKSISRLADFNAVCPEVDRLNAPRDRIRAGSGFDLRKGGARKARSRHEDQDECADDTGRQALRLHHGRSVKANSAPVTIEAGANAAILNECARKRSFAPQIVHSQTSGAASLHSTRLWSGLETQWYNLLLHFAHQTVVEPSREKRLLTISTLIVRQPVAPAVIALWVLQPDSAHTTSTRMKMRKFMKCQGVGNVVEGEPSGGRSSKPEGSYFQLWI